MKRTLGQKVKKNIQQDWKGFQSLRLRRIAVGYNSYLKISWWREFDKNLTRIWQKSDGDLTEIWQESDGNLTGIWRESDKNLTMMIDDSYFMDYIKKLGKGPGNKATTRQYKKSRA